MAGGLQRKAGEEDYILRMLMAVTLISPSLFANKDVERRLDDSTSVLSEVLSAPDKGIPQDLLAKAHGVVVVPGLKKGAFVVGGKYGKGFIACRRKDDAGWSAPAAIRVEGGSFGFQIGGVEIDVVMLVMNDAGANKLLSSQFTLGGVGEVAAGPVGLY
jgi:lipid-binding SYLF domain-containing protein